MVFRIIKLNARAPRWTRARFSRGPAERTPFSGRGRGRSRIVGREKGQRRREVFSAAVASKAPRGGVRAPRPDRDTGALTAAAPITFTRRRRHRRGPIVDWGASLRHHRRHHHRRRRPVPVVGRRFLARAHHGAVADGHPSHAATAGPELRSAAWPDDTSHGRGRPPGGHALASGRGTRREEQNV